jgi:DNA-directed DNA polymerase III PolC
VFVHLHCHSHYSFLRGVASPDEIIAAAVEQKMPAVALTDTNGMYAAVPFYQAAKKAGVKAIVGVTLDVEMGDGEKEREISRPVEPSGTQKARFARNDGSMHSVALVLLAADMEGYSNLCQLVTLRRLGTIRLAQNMGADEEDGRPVTMEELEQHSRGVIALAPMPTQLQDANSRRGTIYRARSENDAPSRTGTACRAPTRKRQTNAKWREQELRGTSHELRVTSYFSRLKEIFGERLYIEVQHLSPGDGRALREAERIGRELGVPLVATNNVHFLRPEEHLHHRAMNAIRTGGLLTTVAPPEITSGEAWFKPAAEMQRVFPDHPEVLRATLEIAERCNLELELHKRIFPEFPVPEGRTPDSYLQGLCFDGARHRYASREQEALPRLTHELEVIEKLNLAPYFLLVWDIVEEARRRGIPAVARGSAASSMVTYCLGISRVCPLRWGLYFERFLNEERGDCPDIDIDICGARRDELLDYVYERWGEEHVAMIGSFVTMHARLAVREVAKVFGVPPGEVNHFTKRLPHRPVREILAAIRGLPECRNLPVDDEPWKTILQVALRLDDAPRHLGIHPCGTVISARPLTRLTPLERATKGIVVTQYDMNAIEALGLIKMDLLGQRGFTTMSLALDNIEKEVKEGKEAKEVEEKSSIAPDGATPCPKPREIDFDAIPENDHVTCDMIAAGRTIGIFQIESPAMRSMLRMMKARTLKEVAVALALIRPGAAEYGSKELFLKRLLGPLADRGKQEPVVYAHESLQSILGDTLGVCIYQEQVMQIAQAVGRMSLQEADLVRRSAAKFSGQRERERLRGKFLMAAEQIGLDGAEREETWMMVEKFAGFGFCKAHAATYADISYRMAYLKAHHPAEFLAAMCSAGAGFYHVSAYVEEAKRWGIEVRLPSVNHSRMEYTAETGADGRRALRVGLLQVKGLWLETIMAIVRAREEGGAFRSLEDFLRRVPRWNRGKPVERGEINVKCDRKAVDALIKCGAFDEVCAMTRPEMLWRWNLLQEKSGREIPRCARLDRAPLRMTESLFGETKEEDAAGAVLREIQAAEYTQEQKLRYEREILEVCVSGHPLDFLSRNGEVWSDELAGLRGKRVALCGWVVTYRHVGTKNYRNMMFVTLEDQRGVYEAVLFPEAYERYGGLVFETRALRVTGRVEQDGQVNCDGLTALKK